ncbi:MAG: hypothetical protein RBT71_10395, partial [Flavobacteriales bacterium]|nr:hypothetical protein [Flavobacteriales bacterium]
MAMSDLGELLRGRFDGHEVPVDPAVWEAVQARLATAAPAAAPEDGLNDLFRTRFKGHEVHVDPAVWNAVRGRIGTTGTTGVTWAGRIAAVVGTAALVAGALWLLRDQAPQTT